MTAAFGGAWAFVSSIEGLVGAQFRTKASVVIIAADAADLGSTCDAARLLVRRSVLVSVLASLSADDMHFLTKCASSGASRVIVRDVDDHVMGLRQLLNLSLFMHVPEQILRSIVDSLPQPTSSLVTYCLTHSLRRVRVEDVARALGISDRTATNWACRGGFRGVREALSRSRAVVALGVLHSSSLAVSTIADRLNFGSVANLVNTIRRHTGLSLSKALELGDHLFWARRLLLGESPAGEYLDRDD